MAFVADSVTLDTGETQDKLGHLVGKKVDALVTDSEKGIGVRFEDGTIVYASEVERPEEEEFDGRAAAEAIFDNIYGKE